jgi:NAD+ kinase
VVAKTVSAEAVACTRELLRELARRDVVVEMDRATAHAVGRTGGFSRDRAPRKIDLFITLGGDGTLLSIARQADGGAALLWVNLGTLGFLTGISREGLLAGLDEVLSGGLEVDRRQMFEVTVRGPGIRARYRVLNDAVLNRAALARISSYRLELDGRKVTRLRADGMIVATPTGSTAYNLSAGGPIVSPDLDAVVITPICPHALAHRSLLVPGATRVAVTIENTGSAESTFLTLDGQEGLVLAPGSRIEVCRGEAHAVLLRQPGMNLFGALAEKLNWGA